MKKITDSDRDWVSRQKWFHSIDLGDGVVTPGRFSPVVPPNYTLFGFFDLVSNLDLRGATCLDVGTMDGISAFIMKAAGADRVIATDMAPRETFEFVRRCLELDIEYHTPVEVFDVPDLLGKTKVDVMLLAGVLYHVFDPLSVLSACRTVVRNGGYIVVETAYLFDRGRAMMSLNPLDTSRRQLPHQNVFWRPTKAAVEGMLELVGFQVVASVAVEGRITILAQARRPSEICTRSPMVKQIHERYMRYVNYGERVDYSALERDQESESSVRYRGPEGHRWITRSQYRPRVPFHPLWRPRSGWELGRELARSYKIFLSSEIARRFPS